MTTSSGSRPGKRLSMLKYRIIIDSGDFHNGLWREKAACVVAIKNNPEQYKTSDWFPANTGVTTSISPKVVEVCGSCSVRLECLTYAVQSGQPDGIWAGRTNKQIRKMTSKIRRIR